MITCRLHVSTFYMYFMYKLIESKYNVNSLMFTDIENACLENYSVRKPIFQREIGTLVLFDRKM